MAKGKKGSNNGYDVGYGKPPKDKQFKKGKSGNPKGRPKGSKNKKPDNHFETIFKNELRREVTVEGPDGPETLTMKEALIRASIVRAVQGDIRSQKTVMDTSRTIDKNEAEATDDSLTININFVD